jgi:hypothetical protein
MMALDPYNNLDIWPLVNIDKFIEECSKHDIKEINLTGSNTDPLLYSHINKYCAFLRERIPGVKLGIRTNGVAVLNREKLMNFDKASISVTSFNSEIYQQTMGRGYPPDLKDIFSYKSCYSKEGYLKDIKINIVLCPELINTYVRDLDITLQYLQQFCEVGLKRVNIRKAYGQPDLGDPFKPLIPPSYYVFNNPTYEIGGLHVTFWDVHYTEVESVNLYANGIVSTTYPVTKGHHPKGKVMGPENFTTWGRKQKQWLKYE